MKLFLTRRCSQWGLACECLERGWRAVLFTWWWTVLRLGWGTVLRLWRSIHWFLFLLILDEINFRLWRRRRFRCGQWNLRLRIGLFDEHINKRFVFVLWLDWDHGCCRFWRFWGLDEDQLVMLLRRSCLKYLRRLIFLGFFRRQMDVKVSSDDLFRRRRTVWCCRHRRRTILLRRRTWVEKVYLFIVWCNFFIVSFTVIICWRRRSVILSRQLLSKRRCLGDSQEGTLSPRWLRPGDSNGKHCRKNL